MRDQTTREMIATFVMALTFIVFSPSLQYCRIPGQAVYWGGFGGTQVPVETQVAICYRYRRVADARRQLGRRTREEIAGEMSVLIYGSAIKTPRNISLSNHLHFSNRRFLAPLAAKHRTETGPV